MCFRGASCEFQARLMCVSEAPNAGGLRQTTKEVKIPQGSSVVIVNSNKKHQLAGLDSEYNQRRAQCEEVALSLPR